MGHRKTMCELVKNVWFLMLPTLNDRERIDHTIRLAYSTVWNRNDHCRLMSKEPIQQCETIPRNNHSIQASYWAVQWIWFARVNVLCNISRKMPREVAASLPGWFLSRRCFTQCITMEVEPRIAKQYKCHHCCSCKTYLGKGMEGGKKCLCVIFWLTRRSRFRGRNAFWGHPKARATSYCLLPDTFWLRTSKNAFKVGGVKFANSSPSIVKKVRTGSKSSQGN